MIKLKILWQKMAPGFLLRFIRFALEPQDYKIRRKAVLAHYKNIDKSALPSEIQEGLKYLKYHKYSYFPYKWTMKYDNLIPEVLWDEESKSYFVLYEGKRMYFPVSYTQEAIIWTVRSALKEQDKLSPHLYLPDDFQVEPGSIVVDGGVAEGNFALSVVEKAKRLYLIECNKEWINALKLTFNPWKEKVIFIEKFVSDEDSLETITIDSFLNPESNEKYFIKLDIEGFEKKALAGVQNLISSGVSIKMDVCTYHYPGDLDEIKEILENQGFNCKVSDGYVLYFQKGEEPSFRKVLVRAQKN